MREARVERKKEGKVSEIGRNEMKNDKKEWMEGRKEGRKEGRS